MPSFEDICRSLFCSAEAGKRLLIGGLLSFVPILNFFAFGYLYRFANEFRRTGKLELPEWSDWGALFAEGVYFVVIAFIYFWIPVLIGWLLAMILFGLSLGFLGVVALFPVSVAVILGVGLMMSALFEFQLGGHWSSLVNWKRIVRRVVQLWPALLLPIILFSGVLFLGISLFGFAFFVGFVLLIVYTTSVFAQSAIENA